MDPNTAMETVKNTSKALTKLGEFMINVTQPYLTRKQADADAYADNKKLATIRDNMDMYICYENGNMYARPCTPQELILRAGSRTLSEWVRQEKNLGNIFDETKQILDNNTKDVADTPVDEDWRVRFINYAKDISATEMQQVWAKILAEEIVKPKSFSLRTLDVVKNLSREEAKIFEEILPLTLYEFMSDIAFITQDDELLEEKGIHFGKIQKLEEAGLLINSPFMRLTFRVSKDKPKLLCGAGNNSNIIIVTTAKEYNVNFDYGIRLFSQAARELSHVLEHTSDQQHIIDCAKSMQKKNANIITIVNEITGKNNGLLEEVSTTIAMFGEKSNV